MDRTVLELFGALPLTALYLVAVGLLVALAVLRFLRTLRDSEAWSLRQIKNRRRFDAVPTESPIDDPTTLARSRAFESIERQFTINRRLMAPTGVVVFVGLGCIPFADYLPAAALSLVAAASTVLIGIAARPYLENAIAGLVISISRTVNIGDTVKLGEHYGTVEDITPTHTTIKIWDWRRFVVPNARMLQESFINYSLNDRFIWAHVEFWVAYHADLEETRCLAVEAAIKSPHYRVESEPPEFWVMELAKEGVRCWVAAWASTPGEAWRLRHDIRTSLATELRRRNLATHVHHLLAPPGTATESEAPLAQVLFEQQERPAS